MPRVGEGPAERPEGPFLRCFPSVCILLTTNNLNCFCSKNIFPKEQNIACSVTSRRRLGAFGRGSVLVPLVVLIFKPLILLRVVINTWKQNNNAHNSHFLIDANIGQRTLLDNSLSNILIVLRLRGSQGTHFFLKYKTKKIRFRCFLLYVELFVCVSSSSFGIPNSLG